ncbi:sugar-binding protein [Aquibacillus salsiterrae]|uniref:Sugar-binding protein n=1 Tax=Aquibacillus salsiterrae TaxID=2950439 RepID=A0A9X3WEQ0_9BACI|nr:sugar-binding protein [Aquibacillus salsiterrae]MDC3418407.1 sugar-binding protein [Aquibacillus salsiterrae]
MNRTTIGYTILIVLFIIAVGFFFYFYQQVQVYDKKLKEATSTDVPLSTYHFVLIGEEVDHEYWRLVSEGAKKAEATYGVIVEYEGPKRSNPEEQLKLLDMAIKSKVDGIIVQALNEQFTPLINGAVTNGIPVITVDTDAPGSLRDAYIGTDNYQAGFLAGKALIEDTNGKATVGIITGGTGQAYQQHQLRVQGFKDAVDKVEGINIVAIAESNLKRVNAEAKAYKMLTEHEEISAFYGTSSLDGMGVVAAAKTLKRQDNLYVITFDTVEGNIQLLKNGDIDAIVEQEPFEMGEKSIAIMLDIIKGKTVNDIYQTNSSIIRKADLPTEKNSEGGSPHD